jgi:hypothetical protein
LWIRKQATKLEYVAGYVRAAFTQSFLKGVAGTVRVKATRFRHKLGATKRLWPQVAVDKEDGPNRQQTGLRAKTENGPQRGKEALELC